MCWKWLYYITDTSEAIHRRPWSWSLRKAEFTFYCFQFLPRYVSLHIRIIQSSLFLTLVCCNNYIGLAHNPDFLFYNSITSSFANTVYEQSQDCLQCQYRLCIWWLLAVTVLLYCRLMLVTTSKPMWSSITKQM